MALGILQLADAYSILSWFLSNFSDVFKFYFFFSLENFNFLIEWSEASKYNKMKILLLVSLVSLTSSIPNHRKVRQIRPEDVRTVSEEQMREMTPEMLRKLNLEYTREFFKPIR